jgi:hypothetical protein
MQSSWGTYLSYVKQRLELDMKQVKAVVSSGKTINFICLDPGRKWPFTAVNLRHTRHGKHLMLYHSSYIKNGHYQHWHLEVYSQSPRCCFSAHPILER